MIEVKINPELKKVKEKFFGLEISQIMLILPACIMSLILFFNLPDELGMIKMFISEIVCLPFIVAALIPFYGMRGLTMIIEIITGVMTNRKLLYVSETYKNFDKIIKKNVKEKGVKKNGNKTRTS